MQACDRCHSRKTRCDRRIPQCTACEKARVPCLHSDKLRQRNLPRGYIDSMEKMVQELRDENRKLRCELQKAAPASQVTCGGRDEADQTNIISSPQESSASQQTQGQSDSSSPSLPSETPTDMFALEVGYLSLVATGETRYLGSSSGMGLANMIGNIVSAQSGVPFSMDNSTPGESRFPPLDISPLDPCFPSRAVAAPFIESYFGHTHITFPLLHRPSFMTTVERIYSEPSYYESNPFEAFVFGMVLAIGSSNFNRFEVAASSSSTYYAMAQSKVNTVMGMDGLTVLRATLLISQHGIFSNLRDTSASIWHLIGIGARLCFELGLHLEHGQLSVSGRNGKPQQKTITLDEEMRKRCFWCLYNLDRVVSVTLGRPFTIRDDEIDVSLPSHLDDDDMSTDCQIKISSGIEMAQKSTPFLHLIRIRRISGQILSIFYNNRHCSGVPLKEKNQVRRRFHEEIISWKNDIQKLELHQGDVEPGPKSSFLREEWYEAVFNNAMLLLYRPSPYLPHPTLATGIDNEDPELLRLLNAAKSSIESYRVLHQRRGLNYSWITLHGVFLAGLAYIYSLARLLQDPTHRQLIPDILSIIETTRNCSNILVAICERWKVSRRSSALFNKLSNAVIQDSLNAIFRPAAHSCNDTTMTGSAALSGANETDGLSNATPLPYNPTLEESFLRTIPQLDEILVLDEFRQYAVSFDMENQRAGSFPSELVSGFSQDWSFETPFDAEIGLGSLAQDE